MHRENCVFDYVFEASLYESDLPSVHWVLLLIDVCRGQLSQTGDRFDEFRVGLDYVSFTVGSRADLDRAVRILDQWGATHGEIEDLGSDFGLYVLAFRDPDNIQLELSAAYS